MRKRYRIVIVIIVLLVACVVVWVWNPSPTSTRLDFQMTTWGTAVNWESLDHSTTKLLLIRRRFWSHAGDAVIELLPKPSLEFWYDDRNGTTVPLRQAQANCGWFDPWGKTGDCYWLRELGQMQPPEQSSASLGLVRQTFLGCRIP